MAEPFAPLLTRKKLLGGTEETTSGTAAIVSAALSNTIVYDVKLVPIDFFADGKRMPSGNYLGTVDAIGGKRLGKLTFKQEIRNGDQFVPMLTCAGYKLTTGVYAPTTDMASRKTWSFAVWEGGRRKGLKGASGTCKISGSNGGRNFAEWEITGVWIAPIDEAMPAQAPINSTSYLASSATFTVAGAAFPLISKYGLDLGNSVEPRESITSADGVLHTMVTEREPKFTVDPEARKVADNDAYGLMLAGTTGALVLTLTTGNGSLAIAAPRMQRLTISDDDRGGKLVDGIVFGLNASSGDDELTFTQTLIS